MSLRGILLAEFKILYGVNVLWSTHGTWSSVAWLATLITVQDLVLSQENARKLTEQLFRSKEKLERVTEQWVE